MALEFQSIGWHAEDMFPTDDSGCVSSQEPIYVINIFGRKENGDTVSVSVKNFTPYFYINVERLQDKRLRAVLYDALKASLPARMRGHFLPARIVKKKTFWGFTNGEQFSFMRLSFQNLKTMRYVLKTLTRPLKISNQLYTFEVFESNIDPYIRFMHINDLQPCNWIRIEPGLWKTYTGTATTTAKFDVEANWVDVLPMSLGPNKTQPKPAPFYVASFDIECTSSSGEFPVAVKNYKGLANQIYDLYKAILADGGDDYRIKQTIHQGLLYSLTGYITVAKDKIQTDARKLFRHNTKYNVSNEKMIDILDANIDGITTLLYGKFNGVPTGNSKDKIISTLATFLNSKFPELSGDNIIQIGTTFHRYGEKECSFKHIVTLGTCDPIEGVVVDECTDEKEMLIKWRNLIRDQDPDIITGFNIFGFDFAYICDRAKQLGIFSTFMQLSRFKDKECEFKESKLSSSALGDNLLRFINMEGRVLIDLMKVVQRDHKLDSYKLDNVAHHFIGLNKNDVTPQEIFGLQLGSSTDRKKIAEYCIQDCALCNLLMMKLEILANNMGMANVCSVPLSFIFMRGQGIKIFSLVLKECKEDGYLIPVLAKTWTNNSKDSKDNKKDKDDDKEEETDVGYEGAIVLEPEVGIYIDQAVSVLDYASLYPSSMISENLSHDMLVLDQKYNNLEGVEYLDVAYDIYDGQKNKIGEQICRFAQNQKGIVPNILMKLLQSRKNTRASMANPELDEFQKAVLDGLQNAYKVTANSLYGQTGSKMSQIYMKDIAACTTATGRKMILMAKKYLEENYNAKVIYGDSVTGYTPTIIRLDGQHVHIETVETIATKFGQDKWIPCIEKGRQEKEACELTNVEIWTKHGWTTCHRVIRHILASHKSIVRVCTSIGVVDVTDDHSLLNEREEKISAKDIKFGDSLLHNIHPKAITEKELKNLDLFKSLYRSFDQNGQFITTKQLEAAKIFMLATNLGESVTIDIHPSCPNIYKLKLENTCAMQNQVKRIVPIEYSGYVYDFTTDNHQFAAGIGKIIVSNTDSIFITLPNMKQGDDGVMIPLKGKATISASIEVATEASHNFKKHLKRPHDLEYEKTFWPFILLSKKRYVGNLYEKDDKKFKQKSMGIVLKRRDNANIVKKIYGGIIDIILNQQDIQGSVKFLQNELQKMVECKCDMTDLVVTKSLRASGHYKDPTRIAHNVLAERIGDRDPGNKPQANDRIPYVYVVHESVGKEKILQGERIETPDYIRKHDLKIDYNFYITNQIMKPVLQLFGIVVEQLPGYNKPSDYYEKITKNLENLIDPKRILEKVYSIRETTVKELLFDPFLAQIDTNKKIRKSKVAEKYYNL